MESTIGRRIQQLRKEKGLSVAKLAEIAGVAATAIYGIQRGDNKPSFEVLFKLREYFEDLNGDWLLTGMGKMLRPLTPAAPNTQQAATDATEPAAEVPSLATVPTKRTTPVMAVLPDDMEEMTPEQQIECLKVSLAMAEDEIASMKNTQRNKDAVQLVRSAGGRAGFNGASLDAADEDYTPPKMTAETISHTVEVAAEAEPIRIRRWGNLGR